MKSKNRFNPSRLHVASGRDEDSGDGGRVAMEDEDDFSLSLSLSRVVSSLGFSTLRLSLSV